MKKLRNFMIVFLIIVGLVMVLAGVLFNYYSSKVGGSSENIVVTIDSGASNVKIGEILKEKDLIKSTRFFKIYLKIFKINNLKAGTYELNKEMSLEEIIKVLEEGPHTSDEEIAITFREGINMRSIAKTIANNTNNSEEDVFKLLSDQDYLKKLIDEYWFITDEILNKDIYYSLEGYLFPDTYRFNNKDVKVDEIFAKLLKKMESVLTPLKPEMEKSEFTVHQLLTFASLAEMEVKDKADYRKKVVSVFVNRYHKKMSLGSDVTTRYSIKLDEKRALKKSEYATINAYNTRSSTMAGKLPAGPISMVSESSILASIRYDKTDYLYFIANINTGETFFYTNSKDFEKKKSELSSVNKGY